MLALDTISDSFQEHNFSPFIAVPCSFLKPLINHVIDSSKLDYIGANNEGEAVAIGAGAWLGGKNPVVMFQNSGLGNAVNPITSLNKVYHIPSLLMVTWRGDPSLKDAPQHLVMGAATKSFLSGMQLEQKEFPKEASAAVNAIEEAARFLKSHRQPFAFVLHKGTFAQCELSSKPKNKTLKRGVALAQLPLQEKLHSRMEMITQLIDSLQDQRTAIISTTGKTSRELYTVADRERNFYMVGSMGCAPSIALGVALTKPELPLIVLDGDGALLMRLEAMASIGYYAPSRFIHVVLDNASYDSTGGQETQSSVIDFSKLAIACGYKSAISLSAKGDFSRAVVDCSKQEGPHLIHVKIASGSDSNLQRVGITPPEIALRFKNGISNENSS